MPYKDKEKGLKLNRERNKIWRKNNKEKAREYSEQYKKNHREEINRLRREHNRSTHKERDYLRKKRLANPELYRNYARKWLQNNKEKHRLDVKKYIQNNSEKIEAQRIAHDLPLLPKCELCPENEERDLSLQHHHPDYNYPTIYVTVCPSCHQYVTLESD